MYRRRKHLPVHRASRERRILPKRAFLHPNRLCDHRRQRPAAGRVQKTHENLILNKFRVLNLSNAGPSISATTASTSSPHQSFAPKSTTVFQQVHPQQLSQYFMRPSMTVHHRQPQQQQNSNVTMTVEARFQPPASLPQTTSFAYTLAHPPPIPPMANGKFEHFDQ